MKMTLAETAYPASYILFKSDCVRHSDHAPITSGFPRKADKFKAGRHFAFVPNADVITI
jgi:hypothetical protein